MSNFYHLAFCKPCDKMTQHLYMDDTPKRHQYTAECVECGHRPVQGEPDWSVMQNMRAMEKAEDKGEEK